MRNGQINNRKVFLTDDDPQVLSLLTACLTNAGFIVSSTSDSREAVAEFRVFSPDICVIDYSMPYMTGSDLLNQFKAIDPNVEIVFLTGEVDIELATELMKRGACDYLLKPVDIGQLIMSVGRARERRRLMLENEAYRSNLEQLVLEKTQKINAALAKLDKLHNGTLEALGKAMDYRDHSTQGHCQRVANATLAIATTLGLRDEELTQTYQGAFLHDIGKLKIPDAILLKPGGLTNDEWKVMRSHSGLGFNLLTGIEFLQPAADIVYSHHERFDGTGYPRQLKGTEIPVGARVFAIVDAVDAMVFKRPYNKPISLDDAASEIERCAGGQFDPELVRHAMPIVLKFFAECPTDAAPEYQSRRQACS